jgi:hypothetical protein
MGQADDRLMQRCASLVSLMSLAAATTACSSLGGGDAGFSEYSLVRAERAGVGDGSLSVAPPHPWNRHRPILFEDVRQVEDWTLNGPMLDGMSFVSGLQNNKSLVRQRRSASEQVPLFRSNMTPPEIAAMIESLYRVRGGAVDFRTTSLQPRPFLGTSGFQLDYEHLDSDELRRRGRAVGAVIDGRLYMVLLDAAKAHYFDAALPDFEATVSSAQLAR